MKTIILIVVLFTNSAMADIHVSTIGEILDPGMYWAVLARIEFDEYQKDKGNKSDLMHHLKQSASYGFNPSRYGIGMIYANGSHGFKIDLPMAYAWLSIAASSEQIDIVLQRNKVQHNLSPNDMVKAKNILAELKKLYGRKATFNKVRRWVDDAKVVTGTRIKGNHSYLGIRYRLPSGKILSYDKFIKRIDKIYQVHLNELVYKINQGKIKIVD